MSRKSIYKYLSACTIFILAILLSGTSIFAGSASLSWNAPTTNSDGSALTDLAGYKLYYGTSPGSYNTTINVGNVTTYQVNNLTNGLTYYFVVTAYDTSQNESIYSNEISKYIQLSIPDITVTDSIAPTGDLQIPFGDITSGNTSTHTVTVRNDGNANLVIGSIAGTNPIVAPFNIVSDTCSGQSIAPASTCTITVRFSPTSVGVFSDSFNIPSNDPDESQVTISSSGTGLSSITNNPPSSSNLVSPANGQKDLGKTVQFRWKKTKDPDGDRVSYKLYFCKEQEFNNGCTTSVIVEESTLLSSRDVNYAGINSSQYGISLFLFVITSVLIGLVANRKKISLLIAFSIAVTILLAACGGGGGGGGSSSSETGIANEITYLASDMETGATYYWNVVAVDENGAETSSETWNFITK